jgi:hypothetical protein
MRVLVGCEYSGIVRDAFTAKGHYAMSCDLLPTESPGPHYQGDLFDVIDDGWDLGIFHPPCTYLTRAAFGAFKGPDGWTKNNTKRGPWRWGEVEAAVDFVKRIWASKIPKKCVENTKGMLTTRWMKPTQTIQPHQFGHPEFKGICLWLDNLEPLKPTDILVPPQKPEDPEEFKKWSRVHQMPPGPNRSKDRSKFYEGVGQAMATQWG